MTNRSVIQRKFEKLVTPMLTTIKTHQTAIAISVSMLLLIAGIASLLVGVYQIDQDFATAKATTVPMIAANIDASNADNVTKLTLAQYMQKYNSAWCVNNITDRTIEYFHGIAASNNTTGGKPFVLPRDDTSAREVILARGFALADGRWVQGELPDCQK